MLWTWMDKGSTGFAFWRILIPVPLILFVSSPPCWPPPFPSITYFGSEKQLPPITCMNSIRQDIVLKVFDSISFWCVDK